MKRLICPQCEWEEKAKTDYLPEFVTCPHCGLEYRAKAYGPNPVVDQATAPGAKP